MKQRIDLSLTEENDLIWGLVSEDFQDLSIDNIFELNGPSRVFY
jgi:hypothetical protein